MKYNQIIKIDGLENDTIIICKDYFLNKIINDPTLTIAEQLEIGDTLNFVYGAPGCVGPTRIDTIQLVKLKDQYLGVIKSWEMIGAKKTVIERSIELNYQEFNTFSKIEKECRLFKLNSGSCSAGPIIFVFKLNNKVIGFVDQSCSKSYYHVLRKNLLQD